MNKMNIIAEVRNFNEAKAAVNSGADEIFFNLEYASINDLKKCRDYAEQKNKKFAAIIPRIINDEELGFTLSRLEKDGVKNVAAGNVGALKAAKEKFDVFAELGMNVFNSYTLELLKKNGVKRAMLSIELNMKELRALTKAAERIGIDAACLVHGDIELMVSRQCINSNFFGKLACEECKITELYIKDEKSYGFPVRRDRSCINHVFNSRELCMLEHVSELSSIGISNLRFNFCFKDEHYIRKVLNAYTTAHEAGRKELRRENDKLGRLNRLGFTKAHYFRGVE